MLSNTFDEIRKILTFGGLRRSNGEIRRAIEASAFDKMRESEEQKGLGHMGEGKPEIPFVRKGTSGGWRELFGDAEREAFKERYGKVLLKTGYESSFNW
jgi:hypothetical protein